MKSMTSLRTGPTDPSAKSQIREFKESLVFDAAAKLFQERGFQGTTLDDIAGALGVSKPFIYMHFKSKYDLLERLFDRVYEDLYETVIDFRQLPEKDPVRRFEYFVSAYLRKNIERRGFSALLLQEEKNLSSDKIADIRRTQHAFDKLLTGLVADGVRAGVFHVDDPGLASLAISGMARWTHRWYSASGRLSIDAICEQLTALALRMLGYDPRSVPQSNP
jgi:TetR/AcrR family transcriptional regulator, cholesterol catabolism regulator